MTRRTGLGDEELLIAVANTAHGDLDELADPASVRAWWQALDGSAVAGHTDTEGAAMLRALRVMIRGLALRNNGIEADVGAHALDGLTLHPDLTPHADPRGNLVLRAGGPDDLARDICAAAVTALLRASARPGWPRFKACRGEDCRWVFVDSSRNTSRRWCDMAGCGNRAKSASFRSRHRVTGAPA